MRQSFVSPWLLGLASALFIAPAAIAKGEINLERPDGSLESFVEVEFINTDEALYLKPEEGVDWAIITKGECTIENELQFCEDGEFKLRTYGVDETIDVETVVMFTNTTTGRHQIAGSRMTLAPNTVVVEILTTEGTYITGIGRIDGTTVPAE